MNIPSVKKEDFNKSNLKEVPEYPGIYLFWSVNTALYVGKSKNLRSRLLSYTQVPTTGKTEQMVSLIDNFSIIKVQSELEALLLEARLVRGLQPKYNSQLKDDKHPLYIQITKEKYPRVITSRSANVIGDYFYGPFPSSTNVKKVLKMLRKIFPYATHKVGKRACLYNQIGLCVPCPSEIEKIEDPALRREFGDKYRKNIKLIKMVLSTQIQSVRKKLVYEMEKCAKEEKFEEAKDIKSQIDSLDYITQPITPSNEYLKNPNLTQDLRAKELDALTKLLSPYLRNLGLLNRIECFDVAHLAGTNPTASMVTLINGEPEKSLYRHFKIISKKRGDDIASMKEVAGRRIKHFSDWGIPDLIIVDGGKPQVSGFWGELHSHKVPLVGLAKRFEILVVPQIVRGILKFKEVKVPKGPALFVLQRARDEAHRFARRLHHKLIQKELLK